MSVVIGVRPGGRSHFAISALYWTGQLPAIHFASKSHSCVQEVLDSIVGLYGEWGNLSGAAIDAPLSWSAKAGGWRQCDTQLKAYLPKWVPSTWIRAPNALTGATTVQGPALVWAMAREAKLGVLAKTEFFETHARACLARLAPDLQPALLDYRKMAVDAETRAQHLQTLVDRLVDPGLIRLEANRPNSPEELESLVCAIVALGCVHPESGLVMREFAGEEIRPVGRRSLQIVDALP